MSASEKSAALRDTSAVRKLSGTREQRKPDALTVAPHIERRMHGLTGKVTLHYVRGVLRALDFTDTANAEDIVAK